jgi:hypothetical protein
MRTAPMERERGPVRESKSRQPSRPKPSLSLCRVQHIRSLSGPYRPGSPPCLQISQSGIDGPRFGAGAQQNAGVFAL